MRMAFTLSHGDGELEYHHARLEFKWESSIPRETMVYKLGRSVRVIDGKLYIRTVQQVADNGISYDPPFWSRFEACWSLVAQPVPTSMPTFVECGWTSVQLHVHACQCCLTGFTKEAEKRLGDSGDRERWVVTLASYIVADSCRRPGDWKWQSLAGGVWGVRIPTFARLVGRKVPRDKEKRHGSTRAVP